MITLDLIKKNQRGRIVNIDTDELPLKLIEMGCLPGNEVHLEQLAPMKDPMYLVIDGCHLAIRTETAKNITIELI
ncbi:ferrous iron transport protein A [Flavobacteriaceae bacterium]|jgi:ferrous iron transport protein A|uniref:FeoA family protein n=1 Tax=Candidatus Arcticimaribacter forsetii TaxID=2820661 RepID=UPI002077792A|nr:FeoA family protein [Candidatus Arcticimaribacter forsetii]MCH1539402.1 ferrous iron transport protein A [Flavobacteriaceae bacterium]MDA8640599.1 ferrous iron transport protein A [Flavobacteriaceae bacterium]MDA8698587.1 ferrous iron transport protein A [Flavobacteriaceae bacterium]MDB2326242.1 ferrous iron transport protein A [Flavobacteriaceae bacterium]MDB2329062.1 ferrous iron transport protein A [Flavobacteriaceae bacterium]